MGVGLSISSGLKKRIRITASGKIKVTKGGKRHRAVHKSGRNKRRTANTRYCSLHDEKKLSPILNAIGKKMIKSIR